MIRPRHKTALTLAICLALTLPALSSRADSDSQLWAEMGLAYRMGKGLQLRFDQHLRLDQDWSRVDKVMPELSFRARLCDYFRLAAGYRFKYERSGSGDFKREHRLHGDASFRVKLKWFRPDLRLRYQEIIDAGEYRHAARSRLRLRLRFWKKVIPFAAAELFTRFGDGDGFRVNKWRFTAGTSLELADHSLDLFYRTEIPIDDKKDPLLHIVGLGYHYDLPLPRI